ncbi:adenylate/guanylate cyclase domain-containing protein [Planctomycetota bacterium]
MEKSVFHPEVLEVFGGYLLSARLALVMVYWGLMVSAALFILQVSDKFGQGILINFLRGKYHQPKEEKRVFMFLDLKSSTTYAEMLGHIRYSRLIQDCFFDLTEIVLKHEAVIYAYVGDEVILTWPVDKGIKDNNCVKVFFDYDRTIRKRGAYYQKQYDMIPEFKAGVNAGRVTVAEVGELKKELAYHGDVLNTAARIQGLCNEYGRSLLISENLISQLNLNGDFTRELLGAIPLKGKQKPVNIFSIEKNNRTQ